MLKIQQIRYIVSKLQEPNPLAQFCSGVLELKRPHCEASHVVPCVCGRSQGVHPPHRHKPDQPVIPRTHTVGETQI